MRSDKNTHQNRYTGHSLKCSTIISPLMCIQRKLLCVKFSKNIFFKNNAKTDNKLFIFNGFIIITSNEIC